MDFLEFGVCLSQYLFVSLFESLVFHKGSVHCHLYYNTYTNVPVWNSCNCSLFSVPFLSSHTSVDQFRLLELFVYHTYFHSLLYQYDLFRIKIELASKPIAYAVGCVFVIARERCVLTQQCRQCCWYVWRYEPPVHSIHPQAASVNTCHA